MRRWSSAFARWRYLSHAGRCTASPQSLTTIRAASLAAHTPSDAKSNARNLLSPTAALQCLLAELNTSAPLQASASSLTPLVTAVQGNACCLDPHACLKLAAWYAWEDLEATVLTPTACDRGPSVNVVVRLAPLQTTLLASLWVHVATQVSPVRSETSLGLRVLRGAPQAVPNAVSSPPPKAIEKISAHEPFPTDALPFVCATLVAFTFRACFPGGIRSAEEATRAMVADVIGPALTLAAAPSAAFTDELCGAALSRVPVSVRAARAWWELSLRCSPMLPVAVRKRVSEFAWTSLDRVAVEARMRVTVTSDTANPSSSSRDRGEDAAFLLAVDALFARLPVLIGGDSDSGLLLPALVVIAQPTLELVRNHRDDGRYGATIARARARMLRRLILECCVPVTTAKAVTTTPTAITNGIVSPRQQIVCALVEQHILRMSTDVLVRTPTRGFDQVRWLAETSLIKWWQRTQITVKTEKDKLTIHRTLAAVITALLQAALAYLAALDSPDSVATAARANSAVDMHLSKRPALSTVLRYTQCWQSWLPFIVRTDPAHALTLLRIPIAGKGEQVTLPRAGKAKKDTFTQRHERLLLRSLSRCLADARASHMPPLLILVAMRQFALLVAEAGDPLSGVSAPITNTFVNPPAAENASPLLLSQPLPLLRSAVLRRLQRQCIGVFLQLRSSPTMHLCYDCAGRIGSHGPHNLAGTATTASSNASLVHAYSNNDSLLFDIPSPSSTDPSAEDREKRRWQLLWLPAVITAWVALSGGPTRGTSMLPFVAHLRSSQCEDGLLGDGGNDSGETKQIMTINVMDPVLPSSVQLLWDDATLLSFLTNLRSDPYDLSTEVNVAYLRMIATTLHESCTLGLGVSSDVLGDGLCLHREGSDCCRYSSDGKHGDTTPGDKTRCWPFLLSVGGAPAAPTHRGSPAEDLADHFLWQEARRNQRNGTCACSGALEETEHTLQPFFSMKSKTDPLRASARIGQMAYALSLFQLGSMGSLSDAVVHASSCFQRRDEHSNDASGEARRHARGWGPCVVPRKPLPSVLRTHGTITRARPLYILHSKLCSAPNDTSSLPKASHQPNLIPLLSSSDEAVDGQSLWRCVYEQFLRFRVILETDLAAGSPSAMSRVTRAASAVGYARQLHKEIVAQEEKAGDRGVLDLAMAYTSPFVRYVWEALDSDTLCAPDSNNTVSQTLTAECAQRALRIFFLNPTATFASVSPKLLLRLWRRAAEGVDHACFPQTLDTLVVWYTVLRLAACLFTIKAEAAAYVVANAMHTGAVDRWSAAAAASNVTSYRGNYCHHGNGEIKGGTHCGVAGVFRHSSESPFQLLEDLAARLSESDERRKWAVTATAPPCAVALDTTRLDDGSDGDGDDGEGGAGMDVASHPFSHASVRITEVLSRPSVHHMGSLVATLRTVEDGPDGLGLFRELDDLVRRAS